MENQIIQNRENKEKISPKYVFLHLFAIIMLYAATINFITLLFQYINVWTPDPLSEINYSANRYFQIIRFALASFIVVFPVFILSSWFLNRNYLKNPVLRDMKTRKWLIYFTLFAAALIIVSDLVSIVFIFLKGEITSRFIFKALSVLVVAGLIFGYYLWDARRRKSSPAHKYFVWAVAALALIAIIAGFFIIGSPQKERLRRFDYERINNLSGIQREIVYYWQKKERLPEKLSDLEDEISGYKTPVDPQTGLAYEYSLKGTETFELCAQFNLASDLEKSRVAKPLTTREESWKHKQGKNCFEKTIDKKLYKTGNPPPPKPF